jgi:bacterioferritin (cytochrome b1)
MLKTVEKTSESSLLIDLLKQILRLEYSFLVTYPRLGRLIKDVGTRTLVNSLGSVRARHADLVVTASHKFGGSPVWDFENVPDNSDLVEIFSNQLEKENLVFKLHQQCANLIKDEEFKFEFSIMADEEKHHIRTLEKVIFNLLRGADKWELASSMIA